jgi:hypothetical protein
MVNPKVFVLNCKGFVSNLDDFASSIRNLFSSRESQKDFVGVSPIRAISDFEAAAVLKKGSVLN